MEDSARIAPEPARPASWISPVTRGVLVAALLLSGTVGGACFLPWFTQQRFDESESQIGLTFIEGIVEFVLAVACFFLFLAVLVKNDPKSRARLAAIGALLAF